MPKKIAALSIALGTSVGPAVPTATADTDPVVTMKSAAPIAMDKRWLGHTMSADFSGPTSTVAINAHVRSRPINEYSARIDDLGSEASLTAGLSGYGVTVDASASTSRRSAMYEVYKLSRVEELDMTAASFKTKGVDGWVPIRIFYGWGLNVLVEGSKENMSLDARARIFDVNAKVVAQASHWSDTARISARGLETKTPNEVVIANSAADVAKNFTVQANAEQPILVEYQRVGHPSDHQIGDGHFQEPGFQPFDGEYASYRLYRDPRVRPGQLHVRMWNNHPGNHAVWEIFRRGEGSHADQWQTTPKGFVEDNIPVPTWPMNLVWVGHATREANITLDAETGWTLDWVRNDR